MELSAERLSADALLPHLLHALVRQLCARVDTVQTDTADGAEPSIVSRGLSLYFTRFCIFMEIIYEVKMIGFNSLVV